MKLFRRSTRPALRLFFATDVHGSDRCFKKFLAAAPVYSADVLILGGDVAGKAMVPILAEGRGRYSFTFQGVDERVDEPDLDEAWQRMTFNGFYPRVVEAAELEELASDPEVVERVVETMIIEQLRGWCDLAAERLPDTVRCIITPGNDDPLAIDEVLAGAARIECPERVAVEVGPVWLASLGNTNRTPWATPREFDESELTQQIAEMVDPVADAHTLVFNFHCPPYNTGLDVAVKLDDDLRPVLDHGNVVEIPVGSTAVRDAIERYQPVVGLHGHIHESQNARRLGRSWCFNPGSEYSSGVLKGILVDLEEDGSVRSHMFTNG